MPIGASTDSPILTVATALTIVTSSLARAGVLPLSFLGVCGCVLMNVAVAVIAAACG